MSGEAGASFHEAAAAVVVVESCREDVDNISGRKPLEELKQIATTELNEIEPECSLALCEIRQWIVDNVDVKCNADHGPFNRLLKTFLRTTKYDREETKKRIGKFHSLVSKVPAWFVERDFRKSLELIEMGVAVPCGYNDNGGRTVIIRLGWYDPKVYSVDNLMATCTMVLESILDDEQLSICGLVIIADCEKFGLVHALQFTPHVFMKMATLIQNALPVRLKGVHIINLSSIYKYLVNFFLMLLKSKLHSRVYVHTSDLDSLQEHFSPSCLPSEYNGKAGPIKDFIAITVEGIYQKKSEFLGNILEL